MTSKSLRMLCLLLGAIVLILPYQNCSPNFKVDPLALSEFSSSSSSSLSETEKIDQGRSLYSSNCSGCHGAVDASTKQGLTLSSLSNAIEAYPQMNYLRGLSAEDRTYIVLALNQATSIDSEITGTPVIAKTWETLAPKSCAAQAIGKDLSMITKEQYANIMSDVFGLTVSTATLPSFIRDYYTPEASNGGAGLQDVSHLEKLYGIATNVTTAISANQAAVTRRISTCDQTLATCQDEIVLKILSRLFREKLSATDGDLVAIKNKFKSTTVFGDKLKMIVTAALLSPRFLYVIEFQKGYLATIQTETVRSVSARELASRLSFLIWNSAPDDALLTVAADGTLTRSGILSAQLARMLADPKAERLAANFTASWLNLSQTTNISTTLMTKLRKETDLFAAANFKSGGDFRNLFLSETSFMDSEVAANYGVPGVSGSTFVEVSRPEPGLRAGLLSHGSVSAVTTSASGTDPIHRGLYLYNRFLCGRIGDPPASASLVVLSGTKYEQMQQRSQNQSCAACHGKFENLGYALEVLGPSGNYRTLDEAGDQTGRSVVLEDGMTSVSSARDLAQAISSNPLSGFCFMRNLEKYASGTSFTFTKGLQCQTENSLYQAYRAGNSFKNYVEQIVLSPVFLQKLEVK